MREDPRGNIGDPILCDALLIAQLWLRLTFQGLMHFLVDCLFDLCACQAHFSSSGMILFRASFLIKDSVTSPQQGFINLPILTCPKSFSFHRSKEIRPDEWQSPHATHIPSDGRSFVCRLPMTLRPRPQTVSSSARPAVTQNDTVRDARNCREEEKNS